MCAGDYWTYSSLYYYTNWPGSLYYCNPTLFWYSFWMSTAFYIVLGALICIGIPIALCVLFCCGDWHTHTAFDNLTVPQVSAPRNAWRLYITLSVSNYIRENWKYHRGTVEELVTFRKSFAHPDPNREILWRTSTERDGAFVYNLAYIFGKKLYQVSMKIFTIDVSMCVFSWLAIHSPSDSSTIK